MKMIGISRAHAEADCPVRGETFKNLGRTTRLTSGGAKSIEQLLSPTDPGVPRSLHGLETGRTPGRSPRHRRSIGMPDSGNRRSRSSVDRTTGKVHASTTCREIG